MILRHRLCIIAPMISRHRGCVPTPGEILAGLFREIGYPVVAASSRRNRYHRLADIVFTIIRKRKDIDVLCVNMYAGPSFVVEDIASFLGRLFGHRMIMHMHGGSLPEFMARHPRWARRVLSRADAIVAPSEYLARATRPFGQDVRVIPNHIDPADYLYRHRQRVAPRLFWMRSFHPIWNPLMAVRVLDRLRRRFPNATLVLAGQDKGMLDEVRQRVERLGHKDAIRLPGFLDREGKAREGNAADIFINTNRIDNMPVAVVEACAMGLPVVSTAVGGIPDLLRDGETGLLVPDDDDAAMAGAIERLLQEPVLAGRLSENGRKLAERSFWPSVRPQWDQLFTEVMGQKRAGSDRSGSVS